MMFKRSFRWLIASTIMAVAQGAWAQGILWDNGERDESGGVASGRNTGLPDAWLVDDAEFRQDVNLTAYRWYAALDPGFEPIAADLVVLSESFEKLVQLSGIPYVSTEVGRLGNLIVYRMEVSALEIGLVAGRYYFGARPVGKGLYRSFTTTKYTILGVTEAYFRSIGFGVPDWTRVSEFTGSPRDIAFTVFGHVVRETVDAESFTVPLGRLLSGEVSDLHQSDDRYITIRDRALAAVTLPMIRMEVQGTTAVETASRITVTVETAASNLPNQPLQRLALFDYIAESWITIDERPALPVDTVVEVIVEDDPTRFIAPGTGQLKMRLDWFDLGATSPWGVRIDHATWTVER